MYVCKAAFLKTKFCLHCNRKVWNTWIMQLPFSQNRNMNRKSFSYHTEILDNNFATHFRISNYHFMKLFFHGRLKIKVRIMNGTSM